MKHLIASFFIALVLAGCCNEDTKHTRIIPIPNSAIEEVRIVVHRGGTIRQITIDCDDTDITFTVNSSAKICAECHKEAVK